MNKVSIAGKLIAIAAIIGLIFLLILSRQLWEHVDAGEIVVIQYPNGNLNVVTSPGIPMQWFGSVEHFRRSSQFSFNEDASALTTRFNDGAHGYFKGSMRIDLPENREQIIDLYRTYRTSDAVQRELVGQNIGKAVYMVGPLMSSKESYSDRRNELISDIEDQAINGIYKTVPKDVEVDDPITQAKKWVRAVEVQKDKTGTVLRQEVSPVQRFGVHLYNLAITNIRYDDVVEKQIEAQQQAIMQVQTAMAKSREAEQQALTIAKQGEAKAAEARWEQETIKAREVTKAQQEAAVMQTNAERDKKVAELGAERDKNVADLARQSAEFTKAQQIALGQGEAERKKLAMAANGALELKLNAWLEAQKFWANSLSNYRGNLVPLMVTGGGGGAATQSNGFNTFMELIGAKQAADLVLDMKMQGQEKR